MAENKLSSYEKKVNYNNEYNREHYKAITIRFDYVKDLDIIEFLENMDSNKAYIATLIRKDIKRYEKKKKVNAKVNIRKK